MTPRPRKLGSPVERELHAPAVHNTPRVTNLTFERAPKGSDEEMLGWVSLDLNGHIHISAIEVYLSPHGVVYLEYPLRKMLVSPPFGARADGPAHKAILDAIREHLGLDGPVAGRQGRHR